MKKFTYIGIAILVGALLAVGGIVSVYAADGQTSAKQGSFFTPDPVDKDLADVGKFRGSLGRMLGPYMQSGRGYNEPPYVSPDDPASGASCGNGPWGSIFGPTPSGQGC